jgi:hypothetical protein
VKFGVGVSLYALPKVFLDKRKGYLTEKGVLTDKGEEALSRGYANWLEETGERRFGEVLDHGDLEGAYGDVESAADQASEKPEEEHPQKLTGAEPEALIAKAEELAAKIPARKKSKATFRRELAGVWHDRDQLRDYVKSLEALIDA